MAIFLAHDLGAARLTAELGDALTEYWLTLTAGDLVGYLKLHRGAAPACVVSPTGATAARPLEIARLYVDFAWHRTDVAPRLMEQALRRAAEQAADAVWLGVWHRNVRAQRFYHKWGFERVGEHPFIFGTDHQTDLVLLRTQDRRPPPRA